MADGLVVRVLALASCGVRKIGVWGGLSLLVIALATSAKALESTYYVFVDDDDTYVRMAVEFLHGHWQSLTLSRGPGWPIFLAASHFLPWTPTLSVFLVYLLGVVLIATSWYSLRGSKRQAFFVVLLLSTNPIFFTTQNQRLERDAFICAVSSVAIGLSLVGVRITQDLTRARLLGLTAVVGVLGVLLVLPRSHQTNMVMACCWARSRRVPPFATYLARRQGWKSAIIRMGLVVMAFVAGLFVTIQTCKTMNSRTSHVAVVDDFQRALARLGPLVSVEAGKVRPLVQITSTMRSAVYAISPTAATRARYLESPDDPLKKGRL